jgi:hypothetical protein
MIADNPTKIYTCYLSNGSPMRYCYINLLGNFHPKTLHIIYSLNLQCTYTYSVPDFANTSYVSTELLHTGMQKFLNTGPAPPMADTGCK